MCSESRQRPTLDGMVTPAHGDHAQPAHVRYSLSLCSLKPKGRTRLRSLGIRTQAHILTDTRGDTVPGGVGQEQGSGVQGQEAEEETHSLSSLASPCSCPAAGTCPGDTRVLGYLGGPGGFILSTIRNPSGSLLTLKGKAILCILGALMGNRDARGAGWRRKSLERRPLPSGPCDPCLPPPSEPSPVCSVLPMVTRPFPLTSDSMSKLCPKSAWKSTAPFPHFPCALSEGKWHSPCRRLLW